MQESLVKVSGTTSDGGKSLNYQSDARKACQAMSGIRPGNSKKSLRADLDCKVLDDANNRYKMYPYWKHLGFLTPVYGANESVVNNNCAKRKETFWTKKWFNKGLKVPTLRGLLGGFKQKRPNGKFIPNEYNLFNPNCERLFSAFLKWIVFYPLLIGGLVAGTTVALPALVPVLGSVSILPVAAATIAPVSSLVMSAIASLGGLSIVAPVFATLLAGSYVFGKRVADFHKSLDNTEKELKSRDSERYALKVQEAFEPLHCEKLTAQYLAQNLCEVLYELGEYSNCVELSKEIKACAEKCATYSDITKKIKNVALKYFDKKSFKTIKSNAEKKAKYEAHEDVRESKFELASKLKDTSTWRFLLPWNWKLRSYKAMDEYKPAPKPKLKRLDLSKIKIKGKRVSRFQVAKKNIMELADVPEAVTKNVVMHPRPFLDDGEEVVKRSFSIVIGDIKGYGEVGRESDVRSNGFNNSNTNGEGFANDLEEDEEIDDRDEGGGF